MDCEQCVHDFCPKIEPGKIEIFTKDHSSLLASERLDLIRSSFGYKVLPCDVHFFRSGVAYWVEITLPEIYNFTLKYKVEDILPLATEKPYEFTIGQSVDVSIELPFTKVIDGKTYVSYE